MTTNYFAVEFPRRIALGATRTPAWSTHLAENAGGFESSNAAWANAKHSYDVSLAVRTLDDYRLVLAHFHTVRGRWGVFGFRDPLDHTCQQSEGMLQDNGDSPAGDWQLYKVYGTWQRRITRPESGVIVYRTRSGVTSVISATVDTSTGRVTISGHMAGDTYAWSGSFLTPCRYGSDQMPAALVDRRPGGSADLVRVDSIALQEVRESTGDGAP